jgi:ubiquinone/menaquinone biosynthesis C-methylase UbiE
MCVVKFAGPVTEKQRRMDNQIAQQLFTQTREGYDAIAEHFAQTRQAPWREVQNLMEQYVHPGDRLLDLGCGNGRVADLANTIKADYTGLDISERLIHIAKQQHPNGRFYVGNMMHTDFPNTYFDQVFLVASFHHIPSRQYRLQTLKEIARITKPGGMIMMTNWNFYQWRFFTTRMRFAIKRLTFRHRMDIDDLLIPWYDQNKQLITNRYYHVFTKRDIARIAKRAGLQVVDHYYETGGQRLPRYRAANLVSILQKPEDS